MMEPGAGQAPDAALEPAFTLVLEASTYRASVACISRGVVLAEREVATGRSEHEHLNASGGGSAQ